jgi:hypothetical protein
MTSVRADPALPKRAEYAKGEWDAMLLSRAGSEGAWDIVLIVEVKAAADSAAGDLPRLIRGLHVLASAQALATYTFQSAQGAIALTGASLHQLPTEGQAMAHRVLYCSDEASSETLRLLSHASRMQLLSHDVSVAYAACLATGEKCDPDGLQAVWEDLIRPIPQHALRQQYRWMFYARELMVHLDDLSAMVESFIHTK